MLYGEIPSTGGFKFTNRNPPKTAILRLPTSDEMIARIRKNKTIRTALGRRQSKSEMAPNAEADLTLFKALCISDTEGPPFDEFEARDAIGKLTACEALGCDSDASGWVVRLKTPFCVTTHVLRAPTSKEMAVYRRGNFDSRDLPHGREELTWNPDAGVALYESVFVSAEGYAAGIDIPAHHKFAVASELAQALSEDDSGFEIGPNS